MGDNKEFEVKAQTRKHGGNGTIQQMATESRSEQKKQKNKKCPKRQPSIYIYEHVCKGRNIQIQVHEKSSSQNV